MCHGYQDFPKQSCKAQCREGEGEVDREEDWKTTIWLDWAKAKWDTQNDGEPRGMEGDGC